jgi:broad specificity phosphatase PhoE
MKRLVLVRHGPTEYTLTGRFCGRHDPVLTPDGLRAAAMVALHPAIEQVDLLVSSPSKRAAQTAAAISERHHVPVRIDERLREIDFGDWEGKTRAELEVLPEYQRWLHDPAALAPPGGECGADVQSRLIDAADDHLALGRNVVFVSHKGAIRLIISHFSGIAAKDYRSLSGVAASSVSRIDFDRERAQTVLIGDTQHLADDVDLGVY